MCAHHMDVWHSIPRVDAIIAPLRYEFMILDAECGGGVPGNVMGHSHSSVRFQIIDEDGTAWGNFKDDEHHLRERPDLYMPLHAINNQYFSWDDGHGQVLEVSFRLELPFRELVAS